MNRTPNGSCVYLLAATLALWASLSLPAQDKASNQLLDRQTIRMTYSEKETTEDPAAKDYGGFSLVEHMENLAKYIAIGDPPLGDPRDLRAAGKQRVDAMLETSPDGKWRVRLQTKPTPPRIDHRIKPQNQRLLRRELQVLSQNLKDWTYELSDTEKAKLRRGDELRLSVQEPLDALLKWSRPALELRLRMNRQEEIPELRFVRLIGGNWQAVESLEDGAEFSVEATYKAKPTNPAEMVEIAAVGAELGHTESVKLEPTADEKIFRSAVIRLEHPR